MPASLVPVGAMVLFVGLFALATWRGAHLGLVMFVAACAVGPALAGMPLPEVVGGFPVGILILVAGVTYFFGIAHLNGTLDRVMGSLVARTGGRRGVLPPLFFGLAAVMAAMGSPQAGLATGPVGMSAARRASADAVLMAIAINSGICAGSFAPTSLFGVITYRIAQQAGIDVSTFILLAIATVANLALLIVASMLFSSTSRAAVNGTRRQETGASRPAEPQAPAPGSGPMSTHQTATLLCLLGLVPGIVGATLAGHEVDIGVVLLTLGVLLALLDPSIGVRAFARIDWSTALVVCGIA